MVLNSKSKKYIVMKTGETPFRILLADDDQLITQMLYHKITSKGCEVDVVSAGWDALQKLEKEQYDLFITDLMMPDISGITLINLLKNYTFSKMPVIIISSLERPDIILSLSMLGVVEYFVKPVPTDLLLNRIRLLKDEKESADSRSVGP